MISVILLFSALRMFNLILMVACILKRIVSLWVTWSFFSNFFVGNFKNSMLYDTIRTLTVRNQRYVDDIFVLVRSAEQDHNFLLALNSVHPNPCFTCEIKSSDGSLSFLDRFCQP